MAKKTKKVSKIEKVEKKPEMKLPENLPPEVAKKLKEMQGKIDKFQKEVLAKFDKYISGIALMPPPKPAPAGAHMPPGVAPKAAPKVNKDDVHLLILVDDSDSKKMSKMELKNKLFGIIDEMARKIDEKLLPNVVLLSELWQSCYDAKYDLLNLVAISAPIYDKGMLSAVKISELHKNMVLKKFEKYIVSYVLFGSLTRGEATPESDIDVVIIIDDTDVKKMTRAELKDKLRAIIIGMGIEAGTITGIQNKLNIQTYILTDFWDGIKEANPVYFTILRDGVPFFDRGLFMPWKQLLRMGKIKPSTEAIDLFMSTGEQMVTRVKQTMKDIIEKDVYWATLTPAQAALMLYGIPPPTPKETIDLLEEIFVKKEKMLEKKYVDILRTIRKYYKGIEHGDIKEVTGKEVDDLLAKAEDYLKRIRRLFTDIELKKEKESMIDIYETIMSIIRDVLRLEGIEKATDASIVNLFENELIATGKVPQKFLRIFKDVLKAKKDYEADKLTKTEIGKVKKDSGELIKFLVEYVQRKRGRELERARIRVKSGKTYGEILLLDDVAFIIHDIDKSDKEVSKAKIKEDGSLDTLEKSSLEEMEKYLIDLKIPPKVFIKQPIFEDLERIFGKDVEVQISRY